MLVLLKRIYENDQPGPRWITMAELYFRELRARRPHGHDVKLPANAGTTLYHLSQTCWCKRAEIRPAKLKTSSIVHWRIGRAGPRIVKGSSSTDRFEGYFPPIKIVPQSGLVESYPLELAQMKAALQHS